MTQNFDDLDSLIGRLQGVARQLDADTPQSEPPAFAYRRFLSEFVTRDSASPQVSDPRSPALAELTAPSLSDEAFLERAYRLLMGRPADPEGQRQYLAQLPRGGRLYVLADMLAAEEARDYMARHAVSVPRAHALTLPLRGLGKLGPVAKLGRPPLRFGYRIASVLLRPWWRLQERLARLEVDNDARDARLRDILLELDGELQRQAGELETLHQTSASHDERIEAFKQTQAGLWSALQYQRRAVERLYTEPETRPEVTPELAEGLDQALLDAYYIAFEDACRGSENEIRTHLLDYQPQMDAARAIGTRALDVGCGRGEWLRLLGEQGFAAHGVDLNVAMVEHCRTAGFEVTHDDAINVLQRQPDDSHALISAFHIAEHLPFDVLYRLVDEAHRVLAPGGILILETPNPENLLVGSHTFYHDPTHLNPLTPTATSFLLQYMGFAVSVRRFHPYPEEAKVPGDDPLTERVNGHLCGPQDFAVIGTKAAPQAADNAAPEEAPQDERKDDNQDEHEEGRA